MYDKIKLYVDRAIVGEQYPTIANYLDNANQITDMNTGETKIYGGLDGLKVSIYPNGLSIVGSLPKFLHKSNVYPLDRHTAAKAIEKMSDALHTHVGGAKVTAVEFGANMLMRYEVQEYLKRLGDMPLMQRYNFDPDTLYFKGRGKVQPKVFAFYDKIADADAKGMEYPDDLRDANLLRYEMRLKGRLPQQLKVIEMVATSLTDKNVYRKLVAMFQNHYFSISKQKHLKTNWMEDIKTVSKAYEILFARLLNQSDPNQIKEFVEELKAAKVFDDRNDYYRLKKKIEQTAARASITESDEFIRELDNEVRNVCAYL